MLLVKKFNITKILNSEKKELPSILTYTDNAHSELGTYPIFIYIYEHGDYTYIFNEVTLLEDLIFHFFFSSRTHTCIFFLKATKTIPLP